MADSSIRSVSSPQRASATNQSVGRVRSGCLTCRTRRVKCDEGRPNCRNCTRLRRTCFYQEGRPRRTSISKSLASSGPPTNASQHPTPPNQGVSPPDDPFVNQFFQEQDFFRQESFFFNGGDLTTADPNTFDTLDEAGYQSLDGISIENTARVQEPLFLLSQNQEVDASLTPWLLQDRDVLSVQLSSVDGSSFAYFLDHVEPPFITPFDNGNWRRMKNYIAELGTRNPHVAGGIAAVEALYEAEANSQDTAKAISLYYAAKIDYTKMLENEKEDFHLTLAVTFLLCCFEIVAQQETVSITLKSDGAFITKLEKWSNHGSWPPISRRLAAWLRIVHAKAMHLGGRGLLSVKVNGLLPHDTDPTPNLSLLDCRTDTDTAIYDHLSSPLFDFFYELQQLSIQTSSINRHHRSRGTVADEAAVNQIAVGIRNKLHALWQRRTSLLRIDSSTLDTSLPPTLSHSLGELISVCTAGYYTELIYLGRAHGEFLQATPEAQVAMREIRKIVDARCRVGNEVEKLNSGYLFPLFMYAVESMDREGGLWAVERLRRIKNGVCHSDFVADLANGLNDEQLKKGERVDTRYFCVERFGVPPPFV